MIAAAFAQNGRGAARARYMTPETIATLTYAAVVKLPTMAD